MDSYTGMNVEQIFCLRKGAFCLRHVHCEMCAMHTHNSEVEGTLYIIKKKLNTLILWCKVNILIPEKKE